MEDERIIRQRIKERLRHSKHYYHYCCVCAGYLYCGTQFFRYTVHYDCRHEKIKYFNAEDNPAPHNHPQ